MFVEYYSFISQRWHEDNTKCGKWEMEIDT